MAQTVTKTQPKKKQPWMRFRHKVVTEIVRPFMVAYCRLRYGVKVPRFRDGKGQYLILLNHQTPMDQFFVGMAFKKPVYYMATEDIFSNGWISKVIKYIIAPIPIKKQTTDIQAVMNCIKIVREGGNICIAPEGNRTYSGRPVYMNPAIAGLARKLGLPILLFRIEGGYGMEPRWSDVVRRGKLKAYVARCIEPEEAKAMTNDELMDAIREGLFVDEACLDQQFHHKKLAEYLERMVYICPDCGLSRFESHNDTVTCTKCGKTFRYLPNKTLQGVGFDSPFTFLYDWYKYQEDYVNQLDTLSMTDTPIYVDHARVSEVIVYQRKEPIYENGRILLYGDRLEIEDMVVPFSEVSTITVLGRNKLNIYHGDKLYQFKGDKRFNALKFMHIYYRSKNLAKGEENGKFLGL